ncbi:MAG: O-antigen ligase family protein [Gaiellales bacterium]
MKTHADQELQVIDSRSMTVASPTAPVRSRTVLRLLAAAGAGSLALASGASLGEGKAAVILPLAVGAGLALAGLAVSHFSAFVLIMLALRSSVDLAKLSGPAAGTTESAGARAFDPSSLLAMLFVVTSALWLAGEYRRTGWSGSRLRLALLSFVACGFISVVGSAHPATSAVEALRIGSAVAMFVVVEQLAARPGGVRPILLAVYASALVPLALTAFGILSGNPLTESEGDLQRTVGSFSQSNEYGRYLMLLVLMGVAVLPHVERRLRNALVVVLGGSSLFLLLTYTRTALIGTVLGLVVIGLVHRGRVLLWLLAAAVMALLVMPSATARFTMLTEDSSTAQSGNSLAWRFDYWAELLPLARENPVTGIGLAETQYRTEEQKQAHNDFLRAFVEMGFLGLGAHLAMIGALIGTGMRAVRRTARGTFEHGVASGFLGSAVAFVVASAASNVFSSVVVLWYFFAFAALASVLARVPSVQAMRATGGGRTPQAQCPGSGAEAPAPSKPEPAEWR